LDGGFCINHVILHKSCHYALIDGGFFLDNFCLNPVRFNWKLMFLVILENYWMKLLEAESYTFETFWRNLKLSHKRDSQREADSRT
jgi:hypothetical protein